MRLLIDECIYQITTNFLIESGHDILTIRGANLKGASDDHVFKFALKEKRILITRDLDFSNIFLFPPEMSYGIIVLKISPANIQEVHNLLKQVLENYQSSDIKKSLIIIDRNKYRVRKLH